MNRKKGFTLIEVLVVIIVIAVIALLAFPSYKKGRLTAQNEQARAKLMEVGNAARMHNEDARGAERVAGNFNISSTFAGFQSPLRLFLTAGNDAKMGFIKAVEWNRDPAGCTSGSCLYHYRGYTFYVCNPDGLTNAGAAQPSGSGCTSKMIATMHGPTALKSDGSVSQDAINEYSGKMWWVSSENLGVIGSNYGG